MIKKPNFYEELSIILNKELNCENIPEVGFIPIGIFSTNRDQTEGQGDAFIGVMQEIIKHVMQGEERGNIYPNQNYACVKFSIRSTSRTSIDAYIHQMKISLSKMKYIFKNNHQKYMRDIIDGDDVFFFMPVYKVKDEDKIDKEYLLQKDMLISMEKVLEMKSASVHEQSLKANLIDSFREMKNKLCSMCLQDEMNFDERFIRYSIGEMLNTETFHRGIKLRAIYETYKEKYV